ncbi:MAG: MFS transporter [Legionellaceae bacterium]|nr:MFS transporter [Legionellaceae bacterium]
MLAASFYLYEFILQVSPSVMAEEMMQTFKVSAEGFGIISSVYFYAYAPMQLPAGLLFDRYGPRKLMTTAVLVCASGMVLFAATNSLTVATTGRFLVGIGSACSFIGVLVLISRWFPPQRFALMAGVAQLMSSLGAMFGEMPLAVLIQWTSWRQASFILAAIGLFIAALLWIFVSDYPNPPKKPGKKRSFSREILRLKEVCSQSYTWIIGAYAFTIWTPIAVFAALWGVPYLQEKYHISVIAASGMCSMIWLGIGVGSPALGWLSDHLESRRIALGISAFMGLVATLLILYISGIPKSWMLLVLFALGIGAGGQSVSFAVVKDNNPANLVGTASGFNNLSVLLGGAIFQPLVGIFLHRSEHWYWINQTPVYTLKAYQWALLVMPLCYLLSLLIVLFILKESHPTHQQKANLRLQAFIE